MGTAIGVHSYRHWSFDVLPPIILLREGTGREVLWPKDQTNPGKGTVGDLGLFYF